MGYVGVENTQSEVGRDAMKLAGAEFERLLTAEEAAMHLRMHPKTLQRMARGGHVPCIRIGKYWFFRLSALDVWVRAMENRCSQPFCVK